MQLANSSNPFAQFAPLGSSNSDPNPWAAPSSSTPDALQKSPAQPLAAAPHQEAEQEKPADFGSWNTFEQAAPVSYPAIDDSRHPDVSRQTAGVPNAMPQEQQQYPAPPTGRGAQQQAGFGEDWAAFGPNGQPSQSAPQQQQPAPVADIWSSLDRNQQPPQHKQEPRSAIVDSWASFDAPSEASGLGAPVASQQTSQGFSNTNSQYPWSAFDPGNNAGARSRAGAGAAAGRHPPTSTAAQQANQQPPAQPAGYGGISQPTSPDRKNSIEEIPMQDLGLEGLTITAQPKAANAQPQDYGSLQTGSSQGQVAQPLPKPKRGSSNQFGSVFAPGSANSVSKLTNMFKKDKDKKQSPSGGAGQYEQQSADAGAIGPVSQAPPNSLPPTPSRRRGPAPQGQGQLQAQTSEVDSWRPQSLEERQQCMDAFDHKVSGAAACMPICQAQGVACASMQTMISLQEGSLLCAFFLLSSAVAALVLLVLARTA